MRIVSPNKAISDSKIARNLPKSRNNRNLKRAFTKIVFTSLFNNNYEN